MAHCKKIIIIKKSNNNVTLHILAECMCIHDNNMNPYCDLMELEHCTIS